MEKVITRAEQKKENTWALEDIYPSDEAWEKALAEVASYIDTISSYKGKISQSSEALLESLHFNDSMIIEISKLANYAFRKSDEDQTNSKYLEMKGKASIIFAKIGEASAYFNPELISIPDETLERFYAEKPELTGYKRFIDRTRKEKEHSLSPAEEAILAASSNVTDSPYLIFSALENADLKFENVKDKNGKEYQVTNGSYISLVQSPDRVLRKNAFESIYNGYKGVKNTAAAILNSQVTQLKFMADMRKYPSTIEAALSHTEVPTPVYHNLIKTVHNNLDKMYKYIALRKKALKLDELHMYDIYCDMVEDVDKEIPFSQAKETVLEALQILGDDYIKVLKEGFDNRWIDVYENVGKRSGAYSAGGVPHPYVLLNYRNNLDNQFTLAHEMGHSLHTYYSLKNQPTIYSDYVIFVAEVASTCNEVLLMKYLLSRTTDKKERAYLINYFLEQFRTTLYRQTMFAEFELDINNMYAEGKTLTADSLCKRYYELNKLYYGDGIINDELISYEWSRIPHFYYDYYVFQYATGFSAAVAIAEKIIKEGKPAVDNYIKFLSGGCSTDPISLLKIAGIDMASPAPIEMALQEFDSLIDELNELI